MLDILILLGSTREGRKTDRVARAVESKLKNRDVETHLFDLKENPLPNLSKRRFNDDDPHPNTEKLGSLIEDTEVLLIISPEYNHSYPGSLKNALDHFYPEFEDLLFAYMTTSAGGFGGVRQQSHLHDFTLAVSGVPGPSLPVSNLQNHFSEEGEITSEEYGKRIEDFLDEIIQHVP